MKLRSLKNNRVETGIIEDCGHLYPVKFLFDDAVIEPMHIAPWFDEEHDPPLPPMLKYLRGDFFCAPFGDSDILSDEKRGHGASANEKWIEKESTESSVKFELAKKISGASVTKEISLKKDQSVIYQKHTFTSGNGKIPVGHHAMLRIRGEAFISFSEFEYGGTPPMPVETDPAKGRSILKYPQQFEDISSIHGYDNNKIDASVYPFEEGHEDLYMVITKKDQHFGWSAVSNPSEGWLWYSIKNIKILPGTVVWLSNGGRYYPPFSSRHKNVIGIEETASFFHLGHKASIENNFLNEKGYRTFFELNENESVTIPYIFGVEKIPSSFGRVKNITEIPGGIEVTDSSGNKVTAKVDLNFIMDTK